MGEVYRARDTKLNRDVALKVLPEAFALDPERLARFRREAQVLASLNHTNIASIHGFDESDGVQALVLEYVEGPTLADRIAQGAIPLDEALPIARQIADALEAAHEQGIIHRDLKPANIKVRDDGTVKVLDFGLAKLAPPGPGMQDPRSGGPTGFAAATLSPTITSPAMTQVGVLLGTAAYMSPEQAKGREADTRSDLWAFGCVLFEMLAGKRAFDGGDVSDTLAAVLRAEIAWDALPGDVPPSMVTLLKRCLERDRQRRIGDIAVAQFVLAEHAGLTSPRAAIADGPRGRSHGWSLVATVVATALVSAGILWSLWPRPSTPALVRFVHTLGEQDRLTGSARQQVAISPDGTQIVYVANNRLYRRPVADLVSHVIPGTDGDDLTVVSPVFSPDGQWIAYHGTSASQSAIRRIPIDGGSPITIVQAVSPYGMSWDDSGIVYSDGRSGILRVSPNGGTPEVLVRGDENHALWGPQLLPGGDAVLFTQVASPRGAPFSLWDNAQVVVQSLTSAERKTVVDGGVDARYLRSGHLVFAVSGTLVGIAFDPKAQATSGDRVPILAGVRRGTALGVANFAVSNTGALVYVPGPVDASARLRSVSISDRGGTTYRLKLEPRNYTHPRVSPDGTRLVVVIEDDDDADVSIYELSETSSIRRLTVEGRNVFPIWSADGARVAFQTDREGDRSIFWQRADGRTGPERLTTAGKDAAHIPESFSPDGKHLLFAEVETGRHTLHVLSMEDKSRTPFGNVSSRERIGAVFSADGHWVAYAATAKPAALYDADRGVFIQPFPPTGVPLQAPKARIDYHPVWARDGKLFYVAAATQPLVFVEVKTQPGITFGVPVEMPLTIPRPSVFSNAGRSYDVLPDGRILTVSPNAQDSGEGGPAGIHVVLNWFEELTRLVPTGP
jgi:serine/threonine protein kinase